MHSVACAWFLVNFRG